MYGSEAEQGAQFVRQGGIKGVERIAFPARFTAAVLGHERQGELVAGACVPGLERRGPGEGLRRFCMAPGDPESRWSDDNKKAITEAVKGGTVPRLLEKASRALFKGAVDPLVADGQDVDGNVADGGVVLEAVEDGPPVHAGEADIHEDHIWRGFLAQLDGVAAALRFADHAKLGAALKDRPYAVADQFMIVNQYDVEWHSLLVLTRGGPNRGPRLARADDRER